MKMIKKYCLFLVLIALLCTFFNLEISELYAANGNDFEINGTNVLTRYNGVGGSITVPEKVKEIGKKAFAGNGTISAVTLPNSVSYIGMGAFDSCANLEKVILPSKLNTIEDNAFWGCKSLKSVTIPSSVTSIGTGAFCQCDSLAGLYIPQSVTTIKNYSVGFLYINGEYTPTINFVIIGEKNSAAEAYAEKYQIPFITTKDLTAKISKVSNSGKGKVKISWLRNTNCSGYQIQYATDKKFSKAKTVTASAESNSKTISSMKKGKTYYFRIRGYRTVAGKKYYSNWSASKSIRIKK